MARILTFQDMSDELVGHVTSLCFSERINVQGKRDVLREEAVTGKSREQGRMGEQHVVCFKHESSHQAPGPHLSPMKRAAGTCQAVVFIRTVTQSGTGECHTAASKL